MNDRQEILIIIKDVLEKILKREIAEDEYDVKLSYLGLDSLLFTVFLIELETVLGGININQILESRADTINRIADGLSI